MSLWDVAPLLEPESPLDAFWVGAASFVVVVFTCVVFGVVMGFSEVVGGAGGGVLVVSWVLVFGGAGVEVVRGLVDVTNAVGFCEVVEDAFLVEVLVVLRRAMLIEELFAAKGARDTECAPETGAEVIVDAEAVWITLAGAREGAPVEMARCVDKGMLVLDEMDTEPRAPDLRDDRG